MTQAGVDDFEPVHGNQPGLRSGSDHRDDVGSRPGIAPTKVRPGGVSTARQP
jgi:hypothetical protein